MNINKYLPVLILTFSLMTDVEAKKEPRREFKQILPELNQIQSQKNISSERLNSGVLGNLNFKSSGSNTAESISRAYIDHFLSTQNFKQSDDMEFELMSVREGKVTTTARFKQYYQGIEVYGADFSVSINQAGVVKFATHQVFDIGTRVQSKTSFKDSEVLELASAYFGHKVAHNKTSQIKPVIYPNNNNPKLVYQVDYHFDNNYGYWQLLIDANSGEVIRAADMLNYVSVQASVFDPDPLSTSGQTYGGGYVDGNDQNTPQLTQELKTYSIDVLNQNGTYFLTGEWAESVDVENPFDGDFSQASNDFRYNRGQDSFEAVNVYYHISNFLDYLNNDLNLNVKPYQYATGIKFDAHGEDGNDNSFYSSTGLLVFGEGCVDDGEDADVIIHELGHGIHDWVTQGGLSQVNGLSEGTGDYFAQSYSRSRAGYAWTANDPEHHYMFSWDGHNECWGGRTTNYSAVYPNGLVQQIHTDGQIWSSCLMKVWDELGREKTDSMVVEGLSMTNSNTDQAEAAQAVLQAAGELGYATDLNFIADTFNNCGYSVELVEQLAVNITTQPSQPEMGQMVTFSANASGGEEPYSYQWDINGDGKTDGTEQSVTAKYSQAFSGGVYVAVRDINNVAGSAQSSVNIVGPAVELQQLVNIRQNLDQVCGNNDLVIDPGERWSTVIEAKNVGSKTATDAYIAMGVAKSSVLNSITDDYGNTVSDCDRMFIDISNTGTLIPWNSAGISSYTADDEGYATVQLSQAFEHYGQNVASLVASSNGYFNSSTASKGDAWDNDCPMPASPVRDSVGARIAPMHDDLKSSAFYHQYFNNCPRPAETGGSLACEVFLWKGADLWATMTTESIDVQAILYPATAQWVYQYAGSNIDGATSSTGMQNAAASDGLTYACNTANSINSTAAVCTYNKNNIPQYNGAEFVQLKTPVITLGNLAVNQSAGDQLEFAIDEDATCGSTFAINHEASVYEQGFNPGEANIFVGTIGNNSQCNVVTSCGVSDASNDIDVRDGLWWNPNRAGNGVDLHTYNDQALLYVMYTGSPDRSPIWYIANDAESSYNQYYNEILKINYPGGFGANNQQAETVGWSNTTFINDRTAIQVRNINGKLSAEKIIMDQFAADPTPNLHTGHYYSPSDNGWGQSIITLGDVRVAIGYIYDQLGNPFWTIASGSNDGDEKTAVTADTFCPHCPSLPLQVYTIGTLSMDLNAQSNGTVGQYIISYPPASAQPLATWNKTDLPIVNLVPTDN